MHNADVTESLIGFAGYDVYLQPTQLNLSAKRVGEVASIWNPSRNSNEKKIVLNKCWCVDGCDWLSIENNCWESKFVDHLSVLGFLLHLF